ncbi:hypothetical protein CHU98_g6537 [Xylaria longipes]|nr:hypothetical protein CHU98_g6537 [Xylaria longipes]
MAPPPTEDQTTDDSASISSTTAMISTRSAKSSRPASSYDQQPDRLSTEAMHDPQPGRPTITTSHSSNQSHGTTVHHVTEKCGVDADVIREQLAIAMATNLVPSNMNTAETREAHVEEWQVKEGENWADVERRLREAEEGRQAARAAPPEEPWSFRRESQQLRRRIAALPSLYTLLDPLYNRVNESSRRARAQWCSLRRRQWRAHAEATYPTFTGQFWQLVEPDSSRGPGSKREEGGR